MLSCGLSSSHLKGVFFSLLGDDRVSIEQKKKVVSVFYVPATKCFVTEA